MSLTSFTLVLLEPHRFVWQTGASSLFVRLQWADFLLVAVARACSSWTLPRPGLQKKHFSIFKALFPPPQILIQLCMMTFTTSPVTMKQMHLGAFPSMGANWHRSFLGCAIELCTLLKSDCVPSAPWKGPSGTDWEDRNWLRARGVETALQRERF